VIQLQVFSSITAPFPAMSVVLADSDICEKKQDIEVAPEGPTACKVKVQREGCATFLLYVLFIAAMTLLFREFSDQDFSAVLTIGAGFQFFAFTLLLYKVNLTQSVAGLSARTLEMYTLFYLLRLTSTCQKNGYIPVDRSGDWLYQVLDASSLLMVLQLLYAVHVKHAQTYQIHLDLSVDFWRAVPLLVLLGFFVHGDMNHNEHFDVIWMISCYFDTIALIPQLLLMYKLPRIEALNSHSIAAITIGKFCAFLFWFFGFEEMGETTKYNVGGWTIISCHTFILLQSAEFMIKYLRVVLFNPAQAVGESMLKEADGIGKPGASMRAL